MKISSPRPVVGLLAVAELLCGPVALAPAQTIPKGDLVVDLQPFATLPPSGSNQPARASVLTTAPDGRIFANDQRGPLYVISPDGAAVTPYLNVAALTPLLNDNGERGFQSFAFHPDFNAPGTRGFGKFYTLASQTDTSAPATFSPNVPGAGRDHDEVLLEWTAADPAAPTFTAADPAHPFREVLRVARPAGNHNAGYLSFNPTAAAPGNPDRGNLYFGTGDSGGGGDPLGLAQMSGNAYGAILRIDPLGNNRANGRYGVPADNPFVSNPTLLPERWAGGLRNPQRFAWDPANGRMFIADIGQNRVEEINVGQAGANYGWNQREGSFVYNADGSIGADSRGDAGATGFTYPVAEYFHFGGIGNGVTTGPVLRGDRIPGLGSGGRLLFADFPTGTAYTINADTLPAGGPDGVTELRLRQDGVEQSFLDMIRRVNSGAGRADLRFGTDAVGNVYFLNKQDGIIRRLVQLPAPAVTLSADATVLSRQTGQTGTITLSRPTPGSAKLKVPYTVTGPLTSGRDFVISGVLKISAGQTSGSVRLVPLAGGATGKVKLTLLPAPPAGNGAAAAYTVGDANRVKVLVTD